MKSESENIFKTLISPDITSDNIIHHIIMTLILFRLIYCFIFCIMSSELRVNCYYTYLLFQFFFWFRHFTFSRFISEYFCFHRNLEALLGHRNNIMLLSQRAWLNIIIMPQNTNTMYHSGVSPCRHSTTTKSQK